MVIEGLASPAGGAASAQPSPNGLSHYLAKLIVYAMVFGMVGVVTSSRLPLVIGTILFLSNDELIAWMLSKVGIRLVPDSLGANFISAFVFLTAAWVLLSYSRESLPAWLSEAVPANFSWALAGGGALGCAALAFVTTAAARLLPCVGIHIRSDGLTGVIAQGLIGFGILGLLYLVLSTPTIAAWFS